jgi:hypothetical protein
MSDQEGTTAANDFWVSTVRGRLNSMFSRCKWKKPMSKYSGFYGSLELLREQEAEFVKATGPFDRVVSDLRGFLETGRMPPERKSASWAQGLMARARGTSRTFAKALSTLDQMTKSLPAVERRVAAIEVQEQATDTRELVKCMTDALRYDPRLSASDRGYLLLGLGSLAGQAFAKSEAPHPMAAKIDKVKEMLTRVHKNKHAERAAPIIEEALEHIKRGVVDSDDFNRLTVLLNSVKEALRAGDTDVE